MEIKRKVTDNNDMIYGIRAVMEAIEAGKQVDKILVRKDLNNELSGQLFELLKGSDIYVQRVPEPKLNRITRKNHQGVIAFIAPIEYQDLSLLVPMLYEEGKDPFIVVLDGLTDVRNFGAVARTAECAGVDAIVIPKRGSVSVTSDAMKTSAGALNYIPVCRENNLYETVRFLQQSGFKVFSATEKAEQVYTAADLKGGPIALVMGAEDVGVSNEILRISDELIKIPQFGNVASLNVSAASAVLIYEVVRQRTV